ncbi:MAG: HNH endonuclease family protein [Micrococcales bacterium]
MKQITRKSYDWCLVATGILNDPYTGKTIKFVRGVGSSLAEQIDHVVALSNAWSTGAQSISSTSRYQLANDPLNLLAVDGPTNGSKSDKDAASFLPRRAYQCKYVARQLAVKRKYHLWVTAPERTTMIAVLSTCPTQKLP